MFELHLTVSVCSKQTLSWDYVVKALVRPFKWLSMCKKIILTPFPLWRTVAKSCFGDGQKDTEREGEILEESLLQRTQPQTGRARVDEASSQAKAGVASSSSVLEWPSPSLNLYSKTNRRVSWWSQLTGNSLQVWQNFRGSARKDLLKSKCSTRPVESIRL